VVPGRTEYLSSVSFALEARDERKCEYMHNYLRVVYGTAEYGIHGGLLSLTDECVGQSLGRKRQVMLSHSGMEALCQ
jgi:hypothetical protein